MYPDPNSYDVSVRDRVYRNATGSHEGRRSIVVVALTVSVFVFILSMSCRQATAPGPGRNILEAGLVTLTDLDQMIADDGPAVRSFAEESRDPVLTIPGYPLDVVMTRTEVLQSSDAELRELILTRSSALLYAEGIGAFDRTGEQSLRRFSIQGVLEFGVGQVSQGTHDRASVFMLISLVACMASAAVVVATGEGWGRMRSLGLACAAGALPGVIMFWLLRLIVGQIGGDDPFIGGYRDITSAALGVPLRNSLVVFAAGAVVTAAAIALGRVERMVWPTAAVAEDES